VGPWWLWLREKEKGQRGRGPLREKPRWASGPLGRKVRGEILFFFSFYFSNSFQIKSFQFKLKQNFSNFFTEFYKLFKLHTSNQKSMQRQIMMHKHLLSID
jgi:hypothetical protein